MNATETARIVDAISQIKPAQKLDSETPAFWSVILADVRYEDARQAVISLGGKQAFIGPDDIIAEVRRMRSVRLEHSDQILPAVDPDDVQAWLAERRAGIKALADGEIAALPAPSGEIDPKLRAALPTVFRSVPRPLAITAEGGEKPKVKVVVPSRDVPQAEAERMEAERARQLEALRASVEYRKPNPIDQDAS